MAYNCSCRPALEGFMAKHLGPWVADGRIELVNAVARDAERVAMLRRLRTWIDAAGRYVAALQPDADYFEDWLSGIGFACSVLASGPPGRCTEEAVHALAERVQSIVHQAERRAARQQEQRVREDP